MDPFNTDFYCSIDVKQFGGHKDEVNCVAFSSDFEFLVTGSDDERTRVFSTSTGQMVVRLKGQSGAIRCVAISPDSRFIASGSYDKTVIVYRTEDSEALHHHKAHLKSVECVIFSPCSKYLCTTSWDKTGILWEVEKGYMLKLFQGHASLVQCAAFSPCGKMLATGSWDHTVRVWPLSNKAGSSIHILSTHKGNVHAVCFSKHNILATGGWDRNVFLWNPYNGQMLFSLTGHEGWVQAICFSHDGYLCVSVADDEMVRIWSVANGTCLKVLEGKTESASHCGFHPSGALVASGSAVTALVVNDGGTSKGGEAPHQLIGQEILDHLKSNSENRVQSAALIHHKSDVQTGKVKQRPHTASSNTVLTTNPPYDHRLERWLSTSFQRL